MPSRLQTSCEMWLTDATGTDCAMMRRRCGSLGKAKKAAEENSSEEDRRTMLTSRRHAQATRVLSCARAPVPCRPLLRGLIFSTIALAPAASGGWPKMGAGYARCTLPC